MPTLDQQTLTQDFPKLQLLGRPFRLQLICHGMMMFHWDPKDPDHITILMHKMDAHDVALSTKRGAPDNLFNTSQGDYELKLTPNRSMQSFTRAASGFAPDPSKEVILDSREMNSRLIPNSGWVTHKLKVPFPSEVSRGRVVTLDTKRAVSFFSGSAVDTFSVGPSEVAGMHIFTYTGVKAARLIGADSNIPVRPFNDEGCYRLYLYSEERPGVIADVAHLSDFNQLVTHSGADGLESSVDLTRKVVMGIGPEKLDENEKLVIRLYGDEDAKQPPPCLKKDDFLPLNQFPIPVKNPVDPTIPNMSSAKMANTNPNFPDTPQFEANPIECLQGWGT